MVDASLDLLDLSLPFSTAPFPPLNPLDIYPTNPPTFFQEECRLPPPPQFQFQYELPQQYYYTPLQHQQPPVQPQQQQCDKKATARASKSYKAPENWKKFPLPPEVDPMLLGDIPDTLEISGTGTITREEILSQLASDLFRKWARPALRRFNPLLPDITKSNAHNTKKTILNKIKKYTRQRKDATNLDVMDIKLLLIVQWNRAEGNTILEQKEKDEGRDQRVDVQDDLHGTEGGTEE